MADKNKPKQIVIYDDSAKPLRRELLHAAADGLRKEGYEVKFLNPAGFRPEYTRKEADLVWLTGGGAEKQAMIAKSYSALKITVIKVNEKELERLGVDSLRAGKFELPVEGKKEKILEDFTVHELVQFAEENGIDVSGCKRKAEYLEAIQRHLETPEPPDATEPTETTEPTEPTQG